MKLGTAIDLLVETKEEKLEFGKENIFDFAEDTTPIMLEMQHLEKQHYLSKWLPGAASPEYYFEQQFLLDLVMKNEVLEEEIARLTVVTRL